MGEPCTSAGSSAIAGHHTWVGRPLNEATVHALLRAISADKPWGAVHSYRHDRFARRIADGDAALTLWARAAEIAASAIRCAALSDSACIGMTSGSSGLSVIGLL